MILPAPHLLMGATAGVLIAGLIGGVCGYKLRDADYQRHLKADTERALKDQQDVTRLVTALGKINAGVAHLKQERDRLISETTQNNLGRISTYVPASKSCPSVTVGFGLLHDYGARGQSAPVSGPPGVNLSAPAGIDLPTVAGTIQRNYDVCYKWRSEALAWREWYDRNRAAWERWRAGEDVKP